MPYRSSLCATFLFLVGFIDLSIGQDIQFELVPRPTDDFNSGITHIIQDRQGFLWLATETQFLKFDGQRFINFSHQPMNPNSPADFTIWEMTMDHDGIIWLQPGGYGLDSFDPVTGNFKHYRHDDKDSTSVSHDEVTAVFEDRDGILWVGTTAGLDKFDKQTETFTHYRHKDGDITSLSCNEVRVIYQDKAGTLWVGTGSQYDQAPWPEDHAGGLNKFDKRTGKFVRYEHMEGEASTLSDNRVQQLFEDSRGIFWVGTARDGLHTFDRATGKFQRHSYDPDHPEKLSRPPVRNKFNYTPDYITFILEDASQRIWIGTFEGAISVYDPATNTCKYYDVHPDGKGNLAGTGYWSGMKSSDNTIWISTSTKELYKVKPNKKTIEHKTLDKMVLRIAEDEANNLWLGTNGGLIKESASGNTETFFLGSATSNVEILFKGADSGQAENLVTGSVIEQDHIWVSSYGGLQSIDMSTKEFTSLKHSIENRNSPGSDFLNFVEKSSASKLWIGTVDAGLDLFDTNTKRFEHFTNKPNDTTSISNNRLISIIKDRNSNTWAGTFLGLNKFDSVTRTFKRYLKQLAIISLYEDHSGQLWCGTDAGLYMYDKTKDAFRKFIDKSNLITPSMVIGSLIEDHNDNLWLVSPQKGILRLNKERDNATAFSESHGVNRQVLMSPALLRKNGDIIVGDETGYFVLRPDELEINLSPPIIVIDNFLLNEVAVHPGSSDILLDPISQAKEIRLKHDQNTFSFEFTDIDFVSEPAQSRVLYQLENYENQWRPAEDKRKAHYFNLPPGEYVFHVKAINAQGAEAHKQIGVIIYPPWWKTWWGYSAFASIAACVTFPLYRNRINQLKQKQAEQMGLMVATQEGERKRISRDLHDDVGTKLSALKMSLSSLAETADKTNNAEIKTLARNSELFITEVMHDVRQLLLNLSPSILEEFGYTTAIESLIGKLNETKQIKFKLVIFGWQSPIKKDYELAMYRITQELINNVIKHSDAKNVSLQVGQRDGKIILMIEDDGKGFDVTAHRGGYGLRNLDARTKVMNGRMTVDSRAGKGTSVMIEIPYNFG